MPGSEYNRKKEDITLLEAMLRLHGNFRQRLEPIRLTPLQAGIMLYLTRHPDTMTKETAAALAIRPTTLSPTVDVLVRKGWVIRRRPSHDDRIVYLRLTPQGKVLTRKVTAAIRDIRIPR
jgi:DNA-binding MarR family transcriptional regulator